eukprot:CAMPEP_0168443890 /NCGR_PEP_ID=MMETSP0228-20121227/44764_1 /TAXON_ID=133427 /ORGANISM="Protoceratium reticulatum, Strain CCCM 535 (=CCMP 1889)" /LENGTH=242 /DNA_ID=CAMNT_0008458311 /DNA_START=41 /DNA_END=766 /DNA_ORIENTATION=+
MPWHSRPQMAARSDRRLQARTVLQVVASAALAACTLSAARPQPRGTAPLAFQGTRWPSLDCKHGYLPSRRAPGVLWRSRASHVRRAKSLTDLLGSMPKMMEGMKKLPELQKKLKDMPSVGEALDGRVKVTLTGDLAPADVVIDPALMSEISAEELGAAVLSAMRSAHGASVELTRSKLADFYGSMGVPVPGEMTGGAPAGRPSASAASPPQSAHGASVELTRTKLADFYGSMGVPVPPTMTG